MNAGCAITKSRALYVTSVSHTTGPFLAPSPFQALTTTHRRSFPHSRNTTGYGTPEHPFAAVLVMIDPVDWGRDIQLISDVLNSRGAPLDTTSATSTATSSSLVQRPIVPIAFSNPDLLWANHFHLNRLGQGAFAIALEAIYKETNGHPIPKKAYYGA